MPDTTSAAPSDECRTAFEEWHKANRQQPLSRWGDSYKNTHVRCRWEAWEEVWNRRAPQPVSREPLSDEQIRAMCKQSWVFDTAKQWVRITERAHGIGIKKGDSNE